MRLIGWVVVASLAGASLAALGCKTPAATPRLPDRSHASSDPDDWIALPAAELERRACLSHDQDFIEWSVVATEGGPRFIPHKLRRSTGGDVPTLTVADGVLTGTDRGEWGGELRWSSTKSGSGYVIVKDNIQGIHSQDDRVVVVAGLSHLGLRHGAIYELAKSPSGKWQIAHRTLIEEDAEASVADASGGVIIATSTSLLRYQDRALVRLHSSATQWHVNSLVRSADGTFYVGMYLGILRLTPAATRYVETLLVPPDCPVTADHHVENHHAMCRCAMPFVPPALPAQQRMLDAFFNGTRKRVAFEDLKQAAVLAPNEDFKIVEIGRDAHSSHHVVALRTREPWHRHDGHDLIVYTLQGEGNMVLGDQALAIGEGSIVYVPRGTVHSMSNTSAAPLYGYAVFTPPFDGKDRVPVEETPPH